MVELLVEDYPFGFRKLSDHATFEEAEQEMFDRYDAGMVEDFMIKDPETWNTVFKSYKLFKQECPRCGKEERIYKMLQTCDCHGIPYRLVCEKCFREIDEDPGYDGEYYGEEDECIDYDY